MVVWKHITTDAKIRINNKKNKNLTAKQRNIIYITTEPKNDEETFLL